MIKTNVLCRRDPNDHYVDDDYVQRIPSFSRGSVGFHSTSKVVLIVILLYCFVPPMGDHIDVIIQCKPWGILYKKQLK